MMRARYWIGALLVVAALAYLAITSADKSMIRYASISEVLADPRGSTARGVRLVGDVASGSIDVRGPREVWFTMQGDGDSLTVCYLGVVPDTFKDGAEVVVEGEMAPGGHFTATMLLAKCPSKYEAEEAHPDDIPRAGTDRN